MFTHCETIQQALSESIDHQRSLSPGQQEHLNSCAECSEFYHLWCDHDGFFHQLASHSVQVTHVPSTSYDNVLEAIQTISPSSTAEISPEKSSLWPIVIGLSAVAAAITISVSYLPTKSIEPQMSTTSMNVMNDSVAQPKVTKISIPAVEEALSEESLQQGFSRINDKTAATWQHSKSRLISTKDYIKEKAINLIKMELPTTEDHSSKREF